MAAGGHLKKVKSPYLSNSSTKLHKIWRGDPFWPSLVYRS